MGKINAAWHKKNRMPKNPTLEQRIAWHKDHAKNCSCRPLTEEFLNQLKIKASA